MKDDGAYLIGNIFLGICIVPYWSKAIIPCNAHWSLNDFVDDEPSVKKPCVGEKEDENLSPDERWAVVYHFLPKIQLLYYGVPVLIEDWNSRYYQSKEIFWEKSALYYRELIEDNDSWH